jgi:hypothetical protein
MRVVVSCRLIWSIHVRMTMMRKNDYPLQECKKIVEILKRIKFEE